MPQRFCLLIASIVLAACTPFREASVPTAPLATTTAQSTAALATTEPAATVAPVVPTASSATSTSVDVSRDELAILDAADPEPRDQTALVEAFTGKQIPDVVRTTPLDVKVGDVETFWVADGIQSTNYQVDARLRYAGPRVLMYIDTTLEGNVDQSDIERSAKQFEQEIYQRDRQIFGEERSPGIDGDPRLTVLNIEGRGFGGYFSSADSVSKQVNRFSNEREMFIVAIDSYPIGTENYVSTLAHEFQHMIEYNVARRSPSWFNEGMSSLAEDLNGFTDAGTVYYHIDDPDLQLTDWDATSAQTGRHYGTSRLFMRYIYDQYGGDQAVKQLIAADAGDELNAFVDLARQTRSDITSFGDVVADWAVANALNDRTVGDGRYAYDLLPATVAPRPLATEDITDVRQFAADYYDLPQGPVRVRFDGADSVQLADAAPASGSYAWWSNNGDDSIQTLTRAFDLSSVSQATLQFSAWYEIERSFDYAFVSVSTDDGTTWTGLKGNTTTSDDPQGSNVGGQGFTGISGSPGADIGEGIAGQWIQEQVDLSAYAGKQVLLRFWMTSDAALHGMGLMIDNIRIPELNYADDAEQGESGWEAVGFVRTTGVLPQLWELRLVRQNSNGTTVEAIPTDAANRAEIALGNGERGMLVVSASTPFTTQAAQYTYSVEQP